MPSGDKNRRKTTIKLITRVAPAGDNLIGKIGQIIGQQEIGKMSRKIKISAGDNWPAGDR